jgi:hypothetical protein
MPPAKANARKKKEAAAKAALAEQEEQGDEPEVRKMHSES